MERAKQVSESIELGVILALVGGFMDVYSYVGRGGVFANAQTGNKIEFRHGICCTRSQLGRCEGEGRMERAKQVSESIELGVILALVGGFMDVYSYVGRGGVFANAQTGNILLVGVHISEGNIPLAMHFLLPVLCFSVGIMMSRRHHDERLGA